jgi:hypothetical protein
MTRVRPFGLPILRQDVAARLVRASPAPVNTPPPIEWRKFCLNGYPASAQFQNKLNEAANQAVTLMPRQLFWVAGRNTPAKTSFATERARYRFAFRTGPYHHQLLAFVAMQPPETTYGASPSYARLKIFSDVSEATTVATVDFLCGANPGGTVNYLTTGWAYTRTVTLPVDGLSANTDYYACFYDELGARIQCTTVIELQSMTQSNSGYLPQSITNDSEVVSTYRANVAAIQKATWKSCGATLLNWTADYGTVPITIASATATNIIDGTSTTISTSTPGFTLDLTGSDRVSQSTGIPCVMKVFATKTADAALDGTVYLKNSAGSTVASVANQWAVGTTKWAASSVFYMPASSDKYDIQFNRAATGTFQVYAVSIYPYEA